MGLEATIVVDPEGLLDDNVLGPLHGQGILCRPQVINDIADQQVSDAVLAAMTRSQYSLVRLICVRTPGGSVDPVQLAAEREFAQKLKVGADTAHIPLVRGVFCAVGPDAQVPTDFFHKDWEFNVLLPQIYSFGEAGFLPRKPEDGADRVELQWLNLLALGLGCGLFTFLQRGLLDDAKPDTVNDRLHVRIVDAYLRLVDGSDMVSQVVALAMSAGADELWPVPPNLLQSPTPKMTVAEVARKAARRTGIRYQPLATPIPRTTKVGLWVAIKRFVRQVVRLANDEVAGLAFDAAAGSLAAVERAVQQRTVGADATEIVQASVGSRFRPGSAIVQSQAAYLEKMPNVDVPRAGEESSLWEALRSTAFGLLDGGDYVGLMHGEEPEISGQRIVVADPSLVVEVSEPDSDGDEDDGGDSDSADDTAEVGEGSDDTASGEDSPPIQAQSFWGLVEQQMEEVGIYAWGRIFEMQERWEESIARIARARKRLTRARRIVRWLAVATYLVVLGTAAAEIYLWRNDDPEARYWTVAAIGFVLLTVTIGGMMIATRRFNDAINNLRIASANAKYSVDEHQNAINTCARMGRLRAQATDWRAILYCIAHRPLGSLVLELRESPLPKPGIPNMAIAQPVVEQKGWQLSALKVRRQVSRAGWLTGLYLRNFEAWADHYVAYQSTDRKDELRPERDATIHPIQESLPGADGEAVYNQRRQFAIDLVDGRYQGVVFNNFRRSLDTDCKRVLLQEAIRVVRSDEQALDGRSIPDFLGGILATPSDSSFGIFASDATERAKLADDDRDENGVSAKPGGHMPLVESFSTTNLLEVDRRVVFASYRFHLSSPLRPSELEVLIEPDQERTWTPPPSAQGGDEGVL